MTEIPIQDESIKIPDLTPDEQADHARSVRDYPWLDLNDDEYVVTDVMRTGVGRFFIWFCSIGLFALFVAVDLYIIATPQVSGSEILTASFAFCAAVSLLAGFIMNWIYGRNVLIITNRRAFARIQTSPFSYREQSIELERVEDVSFAQNGVLSLMFHYGTVRLSTVGDEQTYKISFADDPEMQTKIIKKIIYIIDERDEAQTRYSRISRIKQ